jgi:hypothetical protein
MPNYYKTSSGERVLKSVVDTKVRQAKAVKKENFLDEYGYMFCEECGKNDCKPIDMSHDISVKQCQEEGRTELAWDVNNITLRGRKCHELHDRNGLRPKGL